MSVAVASKSSSNGRNLMRINLAVFLDEATPQGGELQVKRIKTAIGSQWELIIWQPKDGGKYPRSAVRLRASTPTALVQLLQEEIDRREQTDEWPLKTELRGLREWAR